MWKRFIQCSDNHGDKQNKIAVELFLNFQDTEWKAKERVHSGDNWNFAPLRKKATEDEKRESLQADYDLGREFLQRYQPTHFCLGNHDRRLWDLRDKGVGVLRDYAGRMVYEIEDELSTMKCKLYPHTVFEQGLIRIGDMGITHGVGGGLIAFRRIAKAYSSRCRVFIQGHLHFDHHESIESLDEREGFVCASLCERDLDYNQGSVAALGQRNGFIFGVVHSKTGRSHVWQAKITEDGTLVLPQNV